MARLRTAGERDEREWCSSADRGRKTLMPRGQRHLTRRRDRIQGSGRSGIEARRTHVEGGGSTLMPTRGPRDMQIFDRIADLRSTLERSRRAGRTIGFVPTMGALHDGHLALIDRARAECDIVVVSIFVNPTQFGESEDFALYPRDLARDSALCERSGADIVFAPTVEEMYPRPMETVVSVEPLGSDLIGAVRPGHFRGVATVVTKLFNIVGPHRAYFGEKDFQQLTIIRRMVEDLASPVRIVGVATVREEDGLAMSSRNIRLSPEDRLAARVLSQALDLGATMIESGEGDVGTIVSAMRELIGREPRADLASLDIRSVDGLGPIETIGQEPVVMLITARFGKVLLIDQREAAAPHSGIKRKMAS